MAVQRRPRRPSPHTDISKSHARAVNQLQESSRRVGYLRATLKDATSRKSLPTHNFQKSLQRESLRRAFGKGSLSFGSELSLPAG